MSELSMSAGDGTQLVYSVKHTICNKKYNQLFILRTILADERLALEISTFESLLGSQF